MLWLVGEALLVAGFWLFGAHADPSHLILNFIVSSIVLTVVMMSLLRNTAVLVKRGVGAAMKWFFTITYALLAITGMLYFELANPVDLLTLIIVQAIFFSVLILGMWGAFKPGKKGKPDESYLKMEHNQMMMIRNVISVARTRAERRSDVPASVLNSIVELQEEVHHLYPGNEYVALKMEGRIMLEMNEILRCLKETPLDLKRLHSTMGSCSKLISEYRDTYSVPKDHQVV